MTNNLYAVWSEGYVISGNEAPAEFHGNANASTFSDACRQLLGDRSDFDAARLTLWGCRLFDNEADARKFNG